MQIVSTNQKIVEKTLRDKEGRLIRARFCIYESAGRIKARLVDFVYLDDKTFNKNNAYILAGFSKKETWTSDVQTKKYVSPYVTFKTFYSLGSKPRAPTR